MLIYFSGRFRGLTVQPDHTQTGLTNYKQKYINFFKVISQRTVPCVQKSFLSQITVAKISSLHAVSCTSAEYQNRTGRSILQVSEAVNVPSFKNP